MVYVGYDDGNVYALNAANGKRLWDFTAEENPYNVSFFTSSAIVDGVVYIGSADNNLYALNATNGDKLWNFETGSAWDIESSPAVVNGVVYFGSDDGNVYALGALQTSPLPSSVPEFPIQGLRFTLIIFIGLALTSVIILKISKKHKIP